MYTEEETARNMIIRYGDVDIAGIHATYNLMSYDRGTAGHKYWSTVMEFIYKGESDE
jgi:hypothetical protein